MSGSSSTGKMMIYAHRGASGAAPENTIAAFEQAAEKGADGIELDVHLTSDGKVVVIHDSTVDRTSDGTGTVSRMDYSALSGFDMGAKWRGSKWQFQRLPLLDEVIDIALGADLAMNIELKGYKAHPGLAAEVARIVKSRDVEERTILSSFDLDQLRRAKSALPSIRRALISFFPPPASMGRAEGLWGCHPNHFLTTKSAVSKWQSAGMRVQLWTVNSKESILRAVRLGADGIITNHPAFALTVREGKIK